MVNVFLIAALITAPATSADDQHRNEVAQMAFLAQLAPKVCDDYQTNVEAVAAYMAAAGINEQNLLSDYGKVSKEAGDAFAASVQRDPAAACQQIWKQLGDDGLGLLTTGDD